MILTLFQSPFLASQPFLDVIVTGIQNGSAIPYNKVTESVL